MHPKGTNCLQLHGLPPRLVDGKARQHPNQVHQITSDREVVYQFVLAKSKDGKEQLFLHTSSDTIAKLHKAFLDGEGED